MRLVHSCRHCGHDKSEHNGHSGPNSIGQWFFGECTHGSNVVYPYRIGGCRCGRYRQKIRIKFGADK